MKYAKVYDNYLATIVTINNNIEDENKQLILVDVEAISEDFVRRLKGYEFMPKEFVQKIKLTFSGEFQLHYQNYIIPIKCGDKLTYLYEEGRDNE